MKIYIEQGDNCILLKDDTVDYSNIENENLKESIINEAMDKLENKKLSMEISKQKQGGYKVLKLGFYSKNRNRRYWQ